MSTLIGTDLLAVERSNAVYKETFSNRANIDSTDLLLVERGNTTYKCTYSDWTASPGSSSATHGWGAANTAYDITVRHTQSGGADSTNSFSYFNQSMTTTGGAVTGCLYIGMRLRGQTSYLHDLCISHLQVLQSGGSAYRTDSTFSSGYDWNFHNTGNSNGIGSWLTCTSSLSSQTYTADPSTLSYGSISTGGNKYKWNRATNTGSSWTGANDGTYTANYSGGGGSIITGANAQASNTYYIYTETSGSGYTIGTTALWLKSPEITLYNGDILRMSYHADGGSTAINGLGWRGDDVLYFRFK